MNEDLLEQSGIEVDARTARFWKKNRSPMEDDPKYRDLKKLIGELARRAAPRRASCGCSRHWAVYNTKKYYVPTLVVTQ